MDDKGRQTSKEAIVEMVRHHGRAYVTHQMIKEIFVGDRKPGKLGDMEVAIFDLAGHRPPQTAMQEVENFCQAEGLVYEDTYYGEPCVRFLKKDPATGLPVYEPEALSPRTAHARRLRQLMEGLKRKWIAETPPEGSGVWTATPAVYWSGWDEVSDLINKLEKE